MVRRVLFVSLFSLILALSAPIVSSVRAEELPDTCPGMSQSECDQLKDEYNKLQVEIAGWEKVLAETRAQKGTLQGDVNVLNAQIHEAETQIKAKNLSITKLGKEISARTSRIGELESKIGEGHNSLAALIRRQNQVDDLDIFEVALSTENAFSLFEDVDDMLSVQVGLHQEFAELRGVKAETESERTALAARQGDELDARAVVESKKTVVAQSEAEKQQLLTITTNQETQYNQVLVQRQAQAASIRARLFPLRDTANIAFGDALKYAQEASSKTGVRAALVLAVLSQESDLGNNIGNCYVTNKPNVGDGVGKNTGAFISGVMHPTRDVPVFMRITEALGKDWSTTPVSCPQAAGYGGAMGPTQFIPSTWALFEPRIKSTLGVAATNPWNAEHAMVATGLYLGDWSAASGGYTAERNAACAYFSGRACPASGWVASYGDQVMAKATKFQQDIDFLKEN